MSNLPEDDFPAGFGPLVNRLDMEPGLEQDDPREGAARPWRMVLGAGINGVPAFRPVLPAGVGLFDALVLDGRGVNSRVDRNDDFFADPLERRIADLNRFDLAGGFSGRATRGLVNLNTAPVEVLRAMPHQRLGDTSAKPLLTVAPQHVGKLLFTHAREPFARTDTSGWIHSHIQRPILGKRKAALSAVQLRRRNTQI